MARSFNGSNQYLSASASPVTGVPLTISCWIYPSSVNSADTYDAVFIEGNSKADWCGIYVNNGGGAIIGASSNQSGVNERIANSPSNLIANSWNHAAGVFTSSTSRRAFANGVGGTVNTQSATVATLTGIEAGGYFDGQLWGALNGRLAEIAVWNVALSDVQIAALARGVSPLKINTQNLMAYWPLLGTGTVEPNFGISGNSRNLTLNNSPPQSSHPPVMRPFGGKQGIISIPPAAPVGRVKIWNGSTWVLKPVKIWTGSAWIEKPVKIWNGSAWI